MSRCITCRYDQDAEVQSVKKLVPYKIVEGPDGAAWVEVQGNKMSPSQVKRNRTQLALGLLLDRLWVSDSQQRIRRCRVWSNFSGGTQSLVSPGTTPRANFLGISKQLYIYS